MQALQKPLLWISVVYMIHPERDAYLRQLLGYSDLTVWAVVDLEPGWLEPASPMSLWDNSLTPPPIKVHLGTEI